MTWTAPATAVTGNTLTAAFWNAQVRDNMLETAAATATTAGDIVYADAANSMGSRLAHPGSSRFLVSGASSGLAWRQPAESVSGQTGQTTSTLYTPNFLPDGGGGHTSPGPSVTVTTGTLAIVFVSARAAANNTTSTATYIAFSVSGATTQAATDTQSASSGISTAGVGSGLTVVRLQGLTAGSNTFQMEVRVSAGTGNIDRPRILVIPL